MKIQRLRRRQVVVVDRRDRQEDDHVDRDVEEDLVQNVDVEVVVGEVREVDLPQLSKTMSKRKTKLAKSISMLEVDAIDGRLEERDLVEEDCVEEVGKAMVMCRCGGVMSLLTMARVDLEGTRALLPCQIIWSFHLKGVPSWGCSEVVGLSCRCVHAWSLVAMVKSCMIATVVVVVLSCRLCAHFPCALEP